MVSLDTAPYFDDFDPQKKFYRILFRPRFPIQARELNQLQNITQDQLKRFGDHIFEDRSLVIPGEAKLDTRYDWIKIDKSFGAETEEQIEQNWLRQEIVSQSSGIRALVVNYILSNTDDEVVLYVKYLSGSTDGEQSVFAPGELLENPDNLLAPSVLTTSPNPEGVTGTGSAVHISEGVYYVDGFFVLVSQQTLIVDPFNDRPTARVGLTVEKTIVTPEEDASIKDNAIGFPAFNAPGAHRLKIDLKLDKRVLNLNAPVDPEQEESFIELMRIQSGIILAQIDRSDYSILEKTLARRTFDESGSYTVRDFPVEIREFYREGGNNGIYRYEDFFFSTVAEAEQVAVSRFGLDPSRIEPLHHNVGGSAVPGEDKDEFEELARGLLVIGVDPGKAYVEGYEIETIAKRYIDYRKAREFQFSNSVTIPTEVGNFVLIEDLNGIPNITEYSVVDLYDERVDTKGTKSGTKIGEARVRAIRFDSGTIAANMDAAVFRLYLFDIQMNEGKSFEQVKSIYKDRAPIGDGPEDFTCNIKLDEFFLSGTVTQDGSGNLTGVGTFFQSRQSQALLPDDWIVIFDGSNKKYRRVVSVSTDSSAVVEPDGAPDAITSSSNFAYVFATLRGVDRNILLFPMAHRSVRSIRNSSNEVRTSYTSKREFTAVVGGGSVTLNLTDVYEDFDPFTPVNYVLTKTAGAGPDPIGRIYNYDQLSASITPSDEILLQPAQIVITHPDFANNDTIKVVATVRKKSLTASQEKQKILVQGQFVNSGVGEEDLRVLSLGKADIFKLVKITMSADFTVAATSTDTDITGRYTLDDGQRDNLYDLGSIILKPGSPAPTGRIRVEFDYFQHSNATRNYFSVDSYSGIPYEDIPSYTSLEKGLVYPLRDCLDFRPRVNDGGLLFDNVTGSLTEIPTSNVVADYSYYLNRVDKFFLSNTGQFVVKYGVSAVDPNKPDDIDGAMLLYDFQTRAFTFTPKDVLVNKVQNKRYTMRDIGRLENRIERLEYYTSLSLLEQETQDLTILDENGLERFKNGFIVDSFEGHAVGDVLSPEYRCSIDMVQKELRPQFVEDNFRLKVQSLTNCAQYGDLLMLTRQPDLVMISQPLATKTLNVNPYNVFTFVGTIELKPALDEWKDTKRLPDLVVNIDGNFSQIEAQAEQLGTVWGEWQTHWTGIERSRERVDRKIVFGNNPPDATHSTNWPRGIQTTTRTTTTKTGVQSRTGVRATVIPEIVTENIGDRVLDVSYIPFMRTRDVQFVVKGLKPSTRLYAFFDRIDVSEYVTADSNTYDPTDNILSGTPLLTDATGKAEGVFRVPGERRAGFLDTPEGLSFRTGERVFRLTDSPTNSDRFKTAGEAPYRAQGIVETKQGTILNIRNARLGTEIVSEDQSVTQRDTQENTRTRWVDPLAQSFLVTEDGGAYISKIEVFFATKDENIPVTLEIREMVNGYPGQRVFPFGSKVLDAIDVNLSSNGVDDPTVFEFDTPVFIPQDTEVCFVLLSNSDEYEVYIATATEPVIGTNIPVTEQPYAGVLFKSQNASTWTADQLSDMTFKIYKAQWDENQTGTVILTNDEDDLAFTDVLPPSPLSIISGETKVRVSHPHHSMPVGSRVQLFDVEETTVGFVGGIPIGEIVGVDHEVVDVDADSYSIEVTTPATETLSTGGFSVIATRNLQMDAMHSIIGQLVLPETLITYGIRTTSGKPPQSPSSVQAYNVQQVYADHIPNSTVEFGNQRLVASAVNEAPPVIPGGSKTFFMLASMRTTNPNLSPVIDTERMSIVTVANRIDAATVDNVNFAPFDITELLSASDQIEFISPVSSVSGQSELFTDDAATVQALSRVAAGRYITLTGTMDPANTGTYRVIRTVETSGPELRIIVDAQFTDEAAGPLVTLEYLSKFVDERSPSEGTSLSKYLTRRFVLEQPAIGAKILLTLNKPPSSDMDVYYKTLSIDSRESFDSQEWVPVEYDTPPRDSVSPTDFREVTLTINDQPEFSIIAVKLVPRSTNTARVPVCRDLRVIALGT